MSTLSRFGLGALLLASLAAPASAKASFGVKAGLNTAFFSGDDADLTDDGQDDDSPRLGFVGGLTSRCTLNPTVALQLEALYSQKGGVYENTRGDDEVTMLDYLEVPASVRFGVPLSPLLDAGVSLCWLRRRPAPRPDRRRRRPGHRPGAQHRLRRARRHRRGLRPVLRRGPLLAGPGERH